MMIKGLCQRAFEVASAFLRQQKGSILIYTGAFMAVGVGGAALSIDIGRIVLLRTQMQNRADAGALAGAAQLDANAGAVDRAVFVASGSMKAYSTALKNAGETLLPVWDVNVFEAAADAVSRGPETTNDAKARFVEVIMERKTLSFFYAPAVSILTGQGASDVALLDARAVAMSDPYICKAQPLMLCDPYAVLGSNPSDALGNHIGASILLKQPAAGGGAWTSGNFGLLDLPEDVNYGGGGGANAVEAALNAVEPQGCYGVNATATAPGSMLQKVRDGVNTRFGSVGPSDQPAENVIEYKPDRVMDYGPEPGSAADPLYDPATYPVVGDGIWDLDGYWAARHPGVTRPSELNGASRFQVYLFETGTPFWRKSGGKGVKFALTEEELSGGGWTKVYGPELSPAITVPLIPEDAANSNDTWKDGVPELTPAPNSYRRRLLTIAILDCENNEIHGKTTAPGTAKYISIFLTQQSPAPPDARIMGEIVQALTPNVSFEFHGNVRLVE